MRMTYIYALIDPTNYMIRYVGKANDPYKRLQSHLHDAKIKKFTYKSYWIRYLLSMAMYPLLYIIEVCDESIWQYKEMYWIQYYKELGCKLTNLTPGGDGVTDPTGNIAKRVGTILKQRGYKPMLGRHHTDETKKLISMKNKGRKLNENTKRKISSTMKGKIFSEEVRKKISIANKGKIHTQESRKKMSDGKKGEKNPWYGKHLSEETKKKMSEARKRNNYLYFGRKSWSQESKDKMSKARMGENNPMYGNHNKRKSRRKDNERKEKSE